MKTAGLKSAYANARTFKRYYVPQGTGLYQTRFQGPRLASDAIADARAALARESNALAAYDALTQGLSIYAIAPNGADVARRELNAAREKTTARAFPLNRPGYGDGTRQLENRNLFFWHGTGGVLRNVRDSHEVRNERERGFYCNEDGESFRDGSGLCFGIVAQMRGRKGRARFVPGYRFGGMDDNGTFDLSQVFTADDSSEESANDAARDCAHAANELARIAAERESEYQTGWRAGSDYSDLADVIKQTRADALALLAERRTARDVSPAPFPALCGLIAEKVSNARAKIERARQERAELKDSVYGSRGRGAFSEGAGFDVWKGKAY